MYVQVTLKTCEKKSEYLDVTSFIYFSSLERPSQRPAKFSWVHRNNEQGTESWFKCKLLVGSNSGASIQLLRYLTKWVEACL